MSNDINLWTGASETAVQDALEAMGFAGTDQLVIEKPGWSLFAYIDNVELEDIPDGVIVGFRGAKTLVALNLAPVSASKAAYAQQRKIARALAKSLGGAVEDCQSGDVWIPPEHRVATGLRKAVSAQAPKSRMSLLTLTWFFDHDRFATTDGLTALLSHLGSVLPEALPKRYGMWEPPQYKTERDGLAEFIDMQLTESFVVAYPSAPVYGFYLKTIGPVGMTEWPGGTLHFACNSLQIRIDSAALSAPNYAKHLQDVFISISRIIQPFYADVRSIGGAIRARGTYWTDGDTESHPVASWRGIPTEPVLAHVIGDPYRDIWPDTQNWESVDDLRIIMQPDWTKPAAIEGAPKDIAQPKRPDQYNYDLPPEFAPVFPFDRTSPNKSGA